MTRLPPPPQDFAALKPIVENCAARELLRVASDARTSWCRFNREPRNRFDAPAGQFGVMYAALDLPTAFAEAVLREKPASTGAGLSVPLALSALTTRALCSLRDSVTCA
jgi:RES domain